jgi:hypothetical protein
VESGIRFVFLLAREKLTDRYFVALDLSGPPDHAAIEELVVFARKAAVLLIANRRQMVITHPSAAL